MNKYKLHLLITLLLFISFAFYPSTQAKSNPLAPATILTKYNTNESNTDKLNRLRNSNHTLSATHGLSDSQFNATDNFDESNQMRIASSATYTTITQINRYESNGNTTEAEIYYKVIANDTLGQRGDFQIAIGLIGSSTSFIQQNTTQVKVQLINTETSEIYTIENLSIDHHYGSHSSVEINGDQVINNSSYAFKSVEFTYIAKADNVVNTAGYTVSFSSKGIDWSSTGFTLSNNGNGLELNIICGWILEDGEQNSILR